MSLATNNVLFLEENVIVYPCGHSVVVYNAENNVQLHLLPCSEQTTRVTALALSQASHSSSKRLLAVAEHGPGRGVVCIREFDGTKRTKRKKRELRSPDGAPFVSVAFSNDGKLVLTQGGAPQWQLTLWSWEKAKVIASVRTTTERDASVRRADFNPFDSSLICASGVGLVKFFRVTESALRPMLNTLVKQSAQNFTGHAWLPHGMIIATTDLGEIVLFNDCELAGEVATAAEVGAIDSVVTTSKGFLISEEYGTVRIYQRVVDDDEGGEGGEGAAAAAAAAQHGGAAAPSGDRYEERRIISPFNSGVPAPMKNMAISPAGDTVAVVCSDHQIYSLKLANAEFAAEDRVTFDLVTPSFHGPPRGAVEGGRTAITSVDSCVVRPLVATCGSDRFVRVWNYEEKVVQVMKQFDETPFCVAIHPSGSCVVFQTSSSRPILLRGPFCLPPPPPPLSLRQSSVFAPSRAHSRLPPPPADTSPWDSPTRCAS